jgi:amino acid adenylation domain-containing protein
MNSISERIANLSPEKRELFLKQLKKQKKEYLPTTIKTQTRNSNIFPLSFAQARMWFLNQIEPENSAYNISAALRLNGSFNITILEKCIKAIVKRHEILRTRFAIVEEKPVQIINNCSNFFFSIVDLQSLSEIQKQNEVLLLAKNEAQKPFDLKQDRLLRITLIKLSSQENVVLFTMHHIVSDGWSIAILVKEIATLYQAYLEGKPSPLPELPIQYADFAVWQREWLTKEVLASQLDYWRKQLQEIPRLDLPLDYPRPSNGCDRGATKSFQLSGALTAAIKALAQKEGVTLFMTLLTAFKVLLYRYSHQNEIVVGTPIANRNRAEIEGLIGFFVNTLVLRTNLKGNPSFSKLSQSVREVTLKAYTHQDVPFEQLVEELKVERHLNRHPFFDVMFALENGTGEGLKLPELSLSYLSEETNTALFDLILSMSETETGLVGTIEYSTELFKHNTIDRILVHFQTLLEAIVTEPEQKISQLFLLTAAEQKQLLIEWNNTEKEYPKDKRIERLFEEQVEKTPDAIALVKETQHLTYRELNNKANQLARYLQNLGVKLEKTVGIYLDRSLEMAIAILGILKAGGTYIPIDPNYPTERITEILEDAGVEILLTQQYFKTQFQDKIQLVNLDSNWSQSERESTENYLARVTSENLAYVIYTSGSTGKPKGVAVTHKALVNYTLDIAEQFELQNNDRVLQFAAVGFDVVIEEIFPTWIKGATLVFPSTTEPLSCREFQQLITREQLTVFELPTAYWHQWVLELFSSGDTVPGCVRLAIVGGERISPERLKQWQTFQTPLVHVYGLTETTVTSTLYRLPSNTEKREIKELPIGSAIANTQIYLLDSHLQPVPIGVPGELYIGGAGLARGYLNRADITAQKFIPHPFNREPGARLYKTGDKARYLPDGNIEFLDRCDRQIKIRGYRIELGEIESVLWQHPEIRECVVIDREDVPAQKRLVAYLVTESSQQLSLPQLRSFLKQRLPDYTIPSAFVQLKTLPLTSNGKVDRRALPAPDPTRLEPEETFVAPRSPFEEAIAETWCQVLNIDRVGIHDNFFDLGGHSLVATQLVSRLRDAFAVELPLRSIFESPTIAELAIAIVQNQIEQMDDEEKAKFLQETGV